ncbi:hypothetical protein CCACVL1_00962 [Corchorus capsularis]|uniref:Uncharacterized protein n=1 Tax=Corchorus capsularis TaxID=210143 RepID=A0A1R3KTN1_COCAP|nr:hypothetical protein CCACVL1_00962 [Corchorus capsularis]
MLASEYRHLDDNDYLQMLAVLVRRQFPDCGVDNITERYLSQLQAKHIEAIWKDATEAFRNTFKFLHQTLNLIGPGLVPFRYLYMVLAAYFFRRKQPDYALLKRANLRTASYNSKSRLYRAVVGFYASHEPPELGGAICQAGGAELLGKDRVDSLMNIAYLTQLTNLVISDQNPVDYLKPFVEAAGFDPGVGKPLAGPEVKELQNSRNCRQRTRALHRVTRHTSH